MNVGVVGCGYVGLGTAVVLAGAGHRVVAVEVDEERRHSLASGVVPFAEPGLAERMRATLGSGSLRLAERVDAVSEAQVVAICVPTPVEGDPTADVCREVARVAPRAVIVLRGTSTPSRAVAIAQELGASRIVANPEFLREGKVLDDLLAPSRVVLGGDADAVAVVRRLWAPVYGPRVTVVRTDLATACLAKLAANAMLATRVAFANELARVAARVDASMDDVTRILSLDPRIGASHLQPGTGFGGPCLPKDARLLASVGEELGERLGLVAAALDSNADQLDWLVAAARELTGELAGQRVAVWGRAFKAGTDDLRESPAVALAQRLEALGAEVAAHDPSSGGDPADVVRGADLLVVATPWPQYRQVDPRALAPRHRRALDPSGLLGRSWRDAGWVVKP